MQRSPKNKTAPMTAVFILRREPQAAARLQAELEATPRIRITGVARQVFLACQMVPDGDTELLVSDLHLGDGSALSLLHGLRASMPAERPLPKLLLLTHSVDDALLLEALRAGADGYHVEHDPGRTIGAAIAETMRDEAVMAPSIARQVTGYFSAGGMRPAPLRLSDLDRELLVRIGRGQSPGEIARAEEARTTSASDVRRRIRQIYRKMQWDLRVDMRRLRAA